MTITLRSTKGSALTHAELDGNFTDLNDRVGDAAPTQAIAVGSGVYALTDARRLHLNVEVKSGAFAVDFEVLKGAEASSKWYVQFENTGCTVSLAGDADGTATINGLTHASGGLVRGINGGAAIVEVKSNPGGSNAPVVLVRGDVISPPPEVGARSYTIDDSGKTFVVIVAGTQTIPAGLPAGWEVDIWNSTASSITIDGSGSTNATLAAGEIATVAVLTVSPSYLVRVAKGSTTLIS